MSVYLVATYTFVLIGNMTADFISANKRNGLMGIEDNSLIIENFQLPVEHLRCTIISALKKHVLQ